jgi:hypothetical protein
VHGFGEDYLLESSVVADLCLKVGARGLDVWRLPEPSVFRFGDARSTPDSAAAARARCELDRRLLERRWRDVRPARSRLGGSEPQALCLPHEAADAATQEAA